MWVAQNLVCILDLLEDLLRLSKVVLVLVCSVEWWETSLDGLLPCRQPASGLARDPATPLPPSHPDAQHSATLNSSLVL